MEVRIYQVDAFTDKMFSGNPAAVCPLGEWLSDDVMQQIANENNLAETAFTVPTEQGYDIRWFTPMVEVDLCGHATLAAAQVIFDLGHEGNVIRFHSPRSGALAVKCNQGMLTLDFPADEIREVIVPEDVLYGFNIRPIATYAGKTDLMFVYRNETEVRSLDPKMSSILNYDGRGIIVTAPGDKVDFVSRFFAPQCGIVEDPVTGSAHTTMAPYWAAELKKDKMQARQISRRGGVLRCAVKKDRVEISGKAVLYMEGTIHLVS